MAQAKRINPTALPDTGPLRVAAYCRVSSDSADQLNSYVAQIQYYTEYIGQHLDWELADIYADEGLTGTKADTRDDLQRLIKDCRKGKVDRIIVKSVSRFSRNIRDCLALVRMLKSYKVSVFFEEQGIDTDKMSDEFILTAHGVAAQVESTTLSNNMRWSYRGRMERGQVIGAPAYGYSFNTKKLVIYEPEAVVVRRIFAMFLGGMGKQSIANILNAEGVPRRKGRTLWNEEAVRYILYNERYIGDALLQKSYFTGFPFQQKRNRGERQQYYVENSHQPIISQEDFAAVQRLRRKRAVGERQIAPLAKKIICTDCGRPFRKVTVNHIVYWTCGQRARGRKQCQTYRFTEEAIYNAFLVLVNKLIINREAIIIPMIAQLERLQSRNGAAQEKISDIDKQIAMQNSQLHTLAQFRAQGRFDATEYATQSSIINGRIAALRAKRRELLAADEDDEMLDDLRGLNDILSQTKLQTVFDEQLFAQIIDKIRVVSSTELSFLLVGGLELAEGINYQKRR